jgi:hypothetical protein
MARHSHMTWMSTPRSWVGKPDERIPPLAGIEFLISTSFPTDRFEFPDKTSHELLATRRQCQRKTIDRLDRSHDHSGDDCVRYS